MLWRYLFQKSWHRLSWNKEHTWGRFDNERELRFNGSYPSGHTSLGWSTALVLAEMVPELQDTLLRTGFQYGESRVIVGAHYQSDVDAGYLCGTTAVAVMHASEYFQKDLEAARKEYCKGNPDTTVVTQRL